MPFGCCVSVIDTLLRALVEIEDDSVNRLNDAAVACCAVSPIRDGRGADMVDTWLGLAALKSLEL